MNILIADDEKKVRLTLISMLQEMNMYFEKIMEAENGEKLIKALDDFKPDIAFVDIKMPKLNGLEAIRRAKEISPSTKWIILSGFQEFDFAQQAIEFGVSRYLLKPINCKILAETMNALVNESHLLYIDLNKRFERDIIALYNNFDVAKDTSLEKIITSSVFEAGVIYFDGRIHTEAFMNHRRLFCHEMKQNAMDELSSNIQIAMFNISDYKFAVVCACKKDGRQDCGRVVHEYLRKSAHLARSMSTDGFSATIFWDNDISSYMEINNKIRQLDELGPLRVVLGTGCKHHAEKIAGLKEVNDYSEIGRLVLDVCRCMRENKILDYNQSLANFGFILTRHSQLLNQAVKDNILQFLNCSINTELTNFGTVANMADGLRRYGKKVLLERRQINTSYIEQVIAFTKDNYMRDIGLNIIADSLGITPNYLGSLFYKQTKTKYVDFLTEIRLLKAKELLAETNLSVNKISEMVGYHSVRYFSRLFYKSENQYPSDYRKMSDHN